MAAVNKAGSLKVATYTLLETPLGWQALLYHASLTAALGVTVLLSVVASTADSPGLTLALYLLELLLLLWFSGELLLRVWSAGCRSQYRGWLGRLHFLAFSPVSCVVRSATWSGQTHPKRTSDTKRLPLSSLPS